MEMVFLGTSAMVPTKERNHPGIFFSYKNEGILIDCGENMQRQMKIAGIKLTKITMILISHWHGDHVLGLPGLIQSLSASEYGKTLQIFGPKGTKERIKNMFKAFIFDRKLDLEVKEIIKKRFYSGNDFFLEALPLDHGIETLGFSFVEKDKRKIDMKKAKKLGLRQGPLLGQLQEGKTIAFGSKKIKPDQISNVIGGKKIVYITDTALCKNCYDLAKDADLLICEASYTSKLEDKAKEYKHLTAKQAGLIANRADVKKLILTHFSARYKNSLEIEEDARDVFDNVFTAKDFMKVIV